MSDTMTIRAKYFIFLGDVSKDIFAKTAFGMRDWRPAECAGQWRLPGCGVDLGLPDLKPAEAFAAGARTMVIGVAPSGGAIAKEWITSIVEALKSGLDVASGMHMKLEDVPEIKAAARSSGRSLFNVRYVDRQFDVGTGRKRSGKRLLTVGTDCAVGKKYTVLMLEREMIARGLKADYRATGQTGILISGGGIAIDAIISDFISGAAESLSPDNEADHWDLIEGQGSLFHPGYAGVSVGLLHGSQPDALILCHDVSRTEIHDCAGFPIPSLRQCIDLNLALASLTNPAARLAGVSVNSSALGAAQRDAYFAKVSDEFGVPCIDPIATGSAALVDHLVRDFA